MLTFLLSIVVLSALIFAGYRITMYLYSQRVLGTHARSLNQGESDGIESFSIQRAERMAKSERDESFRFARVVLVLALIFITALVVLAISFLISAFQ
jgi:hypothetical protein